MPLFLVVANQTLAGEALLRTIRSAMSWGASFHIVVPATGAILFETAAEELWEKLAPPTDEIGRRPLQVAGNQPCSSRALDPLVQGVRKVPHHIRDVAACQYLWYCAQSIQVVVHHPVEESGSQPNRGDLLMP